MQPDNVKEIENKIEKYYTMFKEIYTKKHYPDWFEFCKNYNQKFGNEGYKKGIKGHELGHYAILQTPIPPKEPRIVMVGKNNSWFVPDNMKRSLEVVRNLEESIPTYDHYSIGSNFANRLNSQIKQIGFKNKKAEDLLRNHRVGMNRIWLQTGTSDENINKMTQEDQKASLQEKFLGSSLIQRCHNWTEKIIDKINPELVLLFGSGKHGADKLFNKEEGKLEREKASFIVKHCYHPVSSEPFYTNIGIILDGLDEAGLLND